ncbi:NAD(P)/FAD-dependent oxidoreductase [Algivirga pacifica]|uniref:NADH:ubiquinone reductase (non-electrogenic) n=1 Tax=Algivirga pacifica TaxID=1162670 RepID=A0ABP9DC22_9BACT
MENIAVPPLNVPRIVIIGGGFGGIRLAKEFKNKEVQIVLLDKNNYHTFQPLLYQVATAGIEPDSISFPLRKLFKHQRNITFRNARVRKVIPEEQIVETNIGSLSYDHLIIATGSRTNFFGMNVIEDQSMPLKTIRQALDLRHLMLQNFEKALITADLKKRESMMSFIIVGGGPTGVELAGALGELKRHVLPQDYPELDVRRMQIHLVEAGPRLLSALSEKSSQKALDYLKRLDVNVWLDTMVKHHDGHKVDATVNPSGQKLEIMGSNLIWSAGVKGNHIAGLKEDVVQNNGRIKVDSFNQVESYDNIYAIGDVAQMTTEDYPFGHPMVAPVAIQQAKLLAKNIWAKVKGKNLKTFTYKDKGAMATIGKNKAVVEVGKFKSQGAFAWFIWMFVHIMSLVGYRNKAIVFVNWLWNYVNYDRGIRLIIRPFDLQLRNDRRKKEEEERIVF